MKRTLLMALVIVLATGSIAFATTTMKSINVSPNTATVIVNGNKITADNFNYKGTIYVPLRAVSESLGSDVVWDDATKTAIISSKTGISPEHYLKVVKEYWKLYTILESSKNCSDMASKLLLTPSLQTDSNVTQLLGLTNDYIFLIDEIANSDDYLSIPAVENGYNQSIIFLKTTERNLKQFQANGNALDYHYLEQKNYNEISQFKADIGSVIFDILNQ